MIAATPSPPRSARRAGGRSGAPAARTGRRAPPPAYRARGQAAPHGVGAGGRGLDERAYGVKGVEQEMRMNARFQGAQTGFRGQGSRALRGQVLFVQSRLDLQQALPQGGV